MTKCFFVRDGHGISTRARINNIYLYRFKSVVGRNSFLYFLCCLEWISRLLKTITRGM